MKDYNPDKSVVSWAMRFVANLDDIDVVLTGASTLEQLENNIQEFKNADPLNDDEMEILKEVTEIINGNITVDCTKCRYCVDSCPRTSTLPRFLIYTINIRCLGIERNGHNMEIHT